MKRELNFKKLFFNKFIIACFAILLLTSFVDNTQNNEGRPFWGEDCVSTEHTDALGQTCIETCCTRYAFWIAISTSCSWDCLGDY